ncbi:surface-associated interspersed protein 4.1 (SURFIN 4.1) [Plasmodium sp. gorilla clade G2]|uniref:surface-associated interspersed protein 4.1 (SURFIN 4.1) n=1 Tax=Plasmodium sp. gorilla clade G2 TaxID=880535 RepID=UPI000D222B13|nr:surface-associated interspersed protein 4.1 (SURFIN 4.1) [Plasmodium sp. gorilla clade G2]SOV11133.1 surface-associated interspersed protein 4.1 (SURFIN 4.1) [Plasmodium sp. gorilla clade G2]
MHFVFEFENTPNNLNYNAIATERFRDVFEVYVEDKIEELNKKSSEKLNKECRHFNYFIDDIKEEFLTTSLISLPTELRKKLWEIEVDKKLPDLMARSTHDKCLRTEHNFDKNYREIIKILEDYCEDRTTKLRDLEAIKYVEQDCINFNTWVNSWDYEIKRKMNKLDLQKIKQYLEKSKFKCNIDDLDNLDKFFSHVHPRDIKGSEEDPRNSQEGEEKKDEYQNFNSTTEEGDENVERKNIPSTETRQPTPVVEEDYQVKTFNTIVRNEKGNNNLDNEVSTTDERSNLGEKNKDVDLHTPEFKIPKVRESAEEKKSENAKGSNKRTHKDGKSIHGTSRKTKSQINKYAHPNHKYTIFECNDLDCTTLKAKDVMATNGGYGVINGVEFVDTIQGINEDRNTYCFGDECKLGNVIQADVDKISPRKEKRKKGKGKGRKKGNISSVKSSSSGTVPPSYITHEGNREDTESNQYYVNEKIVEEEAASCQEGDQSCIDPTTEKFIIEGDIVRSMGISDVPEMQAVTNNDSNGAIYEYPSSSDAHIEDNVSLFDFTIDPVRHTSEENYGFVREVAVTDDPYLLPNEQLITVKGEVYTAPTTSNEIGVYVSPISNQSFSTSYPSNNMTTLEDKFNKPSAVESFVSLMRNVFDTLKSSVITGRSFKPNLKVSESTNIPAISYPTSQMTLDIETPVQETMMGMLGEKNSFTPPAQTKKVDSSSNTGSSSSSFRLNSQKVPTTLKTQDRGKYVVLRGDTENVPKGIEHYITSVPVALAIFGVLFVFILFNKINPFGTFSSKRKKRKVRRRRYDEKILKREGEKCFENLMQDSNEWTEKGRHDILPKRLYNIEKKEYQFIDEVLNKEDIKSVNEKKIINGDVKKDIEIIDLIELHLDAIEECNHDEWEEYKSEFLEICIEEFFKDRKIDRQDKMMEEKYKYKYNDNSHNIDILKKKELLWNKWIEQNRYIMNNWKDKEWFHNIKYKWEKDIEEYFKLEKYDKNLLEIFEKNRENNKHFMIEILKIIWKRWIEKNVKYINKSATDEWINKLVIEYKNDYIDLKKEYISLIKDIYNIPLENNHNNNYYNIEYINSENLIKIMFIQIYMSVLEEYKKEQLNKNVNTFLDICLDDIKDKQLNEDETNNMIKLINEMKKNKYNLKRNKEKEIMNQFKNELFFKNIMCDWKDCEDNFINDHFIEDKINIYAIKKDIPLKHWNHIYHKWLHEVKKGGDIIVSLKGKEKEKEKHVIDESLLNIKKKRNKWKTIIEIYMEVMDECKRDEWEESRRDFLQICLEEFIKKDNEDMNNINDELPIEQNENVEDMLMLERQKIIWLQWIKRNKYMLQKWNKEEWFHKLKNDWKDEMNRCDQKLFLLINKESDKSINPMLERQKYIWRKWIAKHLYHLDDWEDEEWFNLLMNKFEKDKDDSKSDRNNKMDDMEKKKLITKLFIEIHMMVIEDFKEEECFMNKENFVNTYINELNKKENSEQNKCMINILKDIHNDIQLGHHHKNVNEWKNEKWFDNLKKEWKEGECKKNVVDIEKENFDQTQINIINNYILEIQKAILKNYWEDMQIKWIDDDNKTDWLKIAINLNEYDNNECRKNIKFEKNKKKNNFLEEIEMIRKINKKVQSKDNEQNIMFKTVIEIHMKVIEEDKKQEWEKNKGDFLEICMQEFQSENQNTHNENNTLVNDYMVQENYMIKRQKIIWNKCIERNRYILEKWKKEKWFENLKNEWKNEQNKYINTHEVYSNIKDENNVKQINPLIESEKYLWKKWLRNQNVLLEKYNEEFWFKKLVQEYEKEFENYDNVDGHDHMSAHGKGKYPADLIALNKTYDGSLLKCQKKKLITKMWIEIHMIILEDCKKEEVQLNKELFLDSCINELRKETESKAKCKMLEIVLDLKDKHVLINNNLESNKRKRKNSNNLFENIKCEMKKNENNYIYEMMLKNDMNKSGKMLENDYIIEDNFKNNMNNSGKIPENDCIIEDDFKNHMNNSGKMLENDCIIEDNFKNNMNNLGNVNEKCIIEMEKNISMRHWENIKKNWINGKEKEKNIERIECIESIENNKNIENIECIENIQNVDEMLEEKYKRFNIEPYEQNNYEKKSKIFNRSNFESNKTINQLIDNEMGTNKKKSDNENEEIWYNGLTLEEIYKNSYTRNSTEYIPYIDEEEYSSLDEFDKKNNDFEIDDIFYKGLTLEEIYKNAYTRNSIEYIPYIDDEVYSSLDEFDNHLYNKRKK